MAVRVFISSASGALGPYREAAAAVCRELGADPVHMEAFAPEREPPLEVCRREVASTDVFVLLLAHRYGARPEGEELSFTELEYRWALEKTGMHLLAFVVNPDQPWPPRDVDRHADADALDRFVAVVRARHLVKVFTDIASLRELLTSALTPVVEALRRAADVDMAATTRPARLVHAPDFHAVPPYVGGTPFVGRHDDLATLDTWARSEDPIMVVEAIGGTGKSALTWEWASHRAPRTVGGLAGRLWWSFYDGSASVTRFLQEALVYLTGQPMEYVQRIRRDDLQRQVLEQLRSQPHVLVLDGFERLLGAYHRFDPSKLLDDEVEPGKRSLIEPRADSVIRELTKAGPSKILISTRLLPDSLERYGRLMPGVRHLRLPGLSDTDVAAMLRRLGIRGHDREFAEFFRPLENHPLLVSIVAGLVLTYRRAPGSFSDWAADPSAGAKLAVGGLPLVHSRNHILAAALDGLPERHRRLLGWLSVLPGSVEWQVLDAINPFTPATPDRTGPALEWIDTTEQDDLDAALGDLQARGLLWWDRTANSYDLHPVVRAYAHERMESSERTEANDRIHDYFQALPAEDHRAATSVEDLRQTITLFRALIGAERIGRACDVWRHQLDHALLVQLGAGSTVVELLTPLADDGPMDLRADLSLALRHLGRLQEAILQEVRILADCLNGVPQALDVSLSRLENHLAAAGHEIARSRCLLLRRQLAEAEFGRRRTLAPGILASFAAEALAQGRYSDATDLLDSITTGVSSATSPWLEGNIMVLRLTLTLHRDGRVPQDQLDEATAKLTSHKHQARLASLRCANLRAAGDWEAALAECAEMQRLAITSGQEFVPATAAFLLAKLGRAEEAHAALASCTDNLHRLHPTLRPHLALAQASRELGLHAEAVDRARRAYRQAWRDGPPYSDVRTLGQARDLLTSMGASLPNLPHVADIEVVVPLEDAIGRYIAMVAAGKFIVVNDYTADLRDLLRESKEG